MNKFLSTLTCIIVCFIYGGFTLEANDNSGNTVTKPLPINILLETQNEFVGYKTPGSIEKELKSLGAKLTATKRIKVYYGTEDPHRIPAKQKIYKRPGEEVRITIINENGYPSVYGIEISFTNKKSLAAFISNLKKQGWQPEKNTLGYEKYGLKGFTLNIEGNKIFFDDGL